MPVDLLSLNYVINNTTNNYCNHTRYYSTVQKLRETYKAYTMYNKDNYNEKVLKQPLFDYLWNSFDFQ